MNRCIFMLFLFVLFNSSVTGTTNDLGSLDNYIRNVAATNCIYDARMGEMYKQLKLCFENKKISVPVIYSWYNPDYNASYRSILLKGVKECETNHGEIKSGESAVSVGKWIVQNLTGDVWKGNIPFDDSFLDGPDYDCLSICSDVIALLPAQCRKESVLSYVAQIDCFTRGPNNVIAKGLFFCGYLIKGKKTGFWMFFSNIPVHECLLINFINDKRDGIELEQNFGPGDGQFMYTTHAWTPSFNQYHLNNNSMGSIFSCIPGNAFARTINILWSITGETKQIALREDHLDSRQASSIILFSDRQKTKDFDVWSVLNFYFSFDPLLIGGIDCLK